MLVKIRNCLDCFLPLIAKNTCLNHIHLSWNNLLNESEPLYLQDGFSSKAMIRVSNMIKPATGIFLLIAIPTQSAKIFYGLLE